MSFLHELHNIDFHGLLDTHGEERYEFYRKRGHDPIVAYDLALCWQRNADEQAERRRSHDTGEEVKHERTSSRWVRPGDGLRVWRE